MDNKAFYKTLDKLKPQTEDLFRRYCGLTPEEAIPHINAIVRV